MMVLRTLRCSRERVEEPLMTRVYRIGLVITFAIGLQAQTNRSMLTLAVDASDAPRKILHAREILTVKPGSLTLLYPKWIPGEHSPTGPIVDLAGLRITANNSPLAWRRDLENMFAIK